MFANYVCQLDAEPTPRYSSMAFLSRSSSGALIALEDCHQGPGHRL